MIRKYRPTTGPMIERLNVVPQAVRVRIQSRPKKAVLSPPKETK